ncbi:HD domain-containing phosphohydrolase [Pseudoalteromonas sp. NBT06-2]|uniref:HD domain-containing phosphohydrolase n=1 Tax=Pseudoalteromonas sp. NBT06-2 TaxID=2025950 RepID=UPI0014822AA6|nr:HD domain-containing phosphohydrolase [Pseudoalteromonas sp. NBT06-2]
MNKFQSTILIVDDNSNNIKVLGNILKPFYNVKATINGNKAIKIAMEIEKPDLILLDVMMPDVDGYEVCRQLKENLYTSSIPIIFITAKTDPTDEEYGLQLGASDFIKKPINSSTVLARIKTHLALSNQNKELERLVSIRTKQIEENQFKIIQILGRAAEYKDNETSLHIIRMSNYTEVLAKAIKLDPQIVSLLTAAAPMHDVGKIGIPDAILKKRGKLTDKEYDIMKLHPKIGAEIIGEDTSALLKMARTVSLSHHEKWDGSGYPYGLSGEDIPIEGRIVAIADVFDALTSVRPYKEAWPTEDAFNFLNEHAGAHFDPTLVSIFLRCKSEILLIKEKFNE